jgi:hypothetical protein
MTSDEFAKARKEILSLLRNARKDVFDSSTYGCRYAADSESLERLMAIYHGFKGYDESHAQLALANQRLQTQVERDEKTIADLNKRLAKESVEAKGS